jgi:hypothetical protein
MYFPFGIPEIYYIVFPTKINHAELPIEIFKKRSIRANYYFHISNFS